MENTDLKTVKVKVNISFHDINDFGKSYEKDSVIELTNDRAEFLKQLNIVEDINVEKDSSDKPKIAKKTLDKN